MVQKRRKFLRDLGRKRYRKMFIIATEGKVTEPQYFNYFNNEYSIIKVKLLKANSQSSPLKVLQRMKQYLKREGLLSTDEAWLVIDKDQWDDQQLGQLYRWSQEQINYGLAVTNPKFEYWLLLHFEDGNSVTNLSELKKRLDKYFLDYDKYLDIKKINKDSIQQAVHRAEIRDKTLSQDWPRTFGNTNIYKLVKKLLNN